MLQKVQLFVKYILQIVRWATFGVTSRWEQRSTQTQFVASRSRHGHLFPPLPFVDSTLKAGSEGSSYFNGVSLPVRCSQPPSFRNVSPITVIPKRFPNHRHSETFPQSSSFRNVSPTPVIPNRFYSESINCLLHKGVLLGG